MCTPIRDGGGERGPVSSDDFLARPRSSAHAVFLMKRAGLHTSLPGYKRQRRGQEPGRQCGEHASKLIQEQQQPQQQQTKPSQLYKRMQDSHHKYFRGEKGDVGKMRENMQVRRGEEGKREGGREGGEPAIPFQITAEVERGGMERDKRRAACAC